MADVDKVSQAAARLEGQCLKDYPEVFEDLGIPETMENLLALDQRVFCCNECGWWFEQPAAEKDGQWICRECAAETA